jgi:carbonic anhydrase/acetyltransferase-like protein (isoleucine patch superfamily)
MPSDSTIIPYLGKTPKLHDTVFVASGARIIGDVEIGADASVWFNTVIRGDVHSIKIGRETNVQDGTVLHVTEGQHPLVIGERVTIGHMAMLHGCTVEDLALIGIGAIVLDGAVIGHEAFIGAGALVTPGVKIPPRTLCLGRPAKPVRDLRPDELAGLVESAKHYVEHGRTYRLAQGK